MQAIEALRRLWMTAAEIAEILALPLSTVSLWLKRIGLGKRSRLTPPEPPNRYERRHPGELVHVDIKKLGRISARGAGHRVLGHRGSQYARQVRGQKTHFTGYEYVHVMVDDHSRLAYAEVLDDLTASCAVAFLRRAVAWFAERGVHVRAVMSDNGCRLRRPRVPALPRAARATPPEDQTAPAADERQSRALHPDAPQRVGVRTGLRELRRARKGARTLPDGATTSRDHTAPSANRHRPRG